MKKIINYYIYLPIVIIITSFVFIFESILNIDFTFDWFHYSIILIDFLFILINFIIDIKLFKTEYVYIFIALMFTIVADLILVIICEHLPIGVGFFILVQLGYLNFIHYEKNKFKFITTIIITLIVLLILIIFRNDPNLNIYVSTLYGLLFISNTTFAIIKKLDKMFIIGLILFMLCDICVALDTLQLFNDPNDFIFRLIWVFYMPSQILITFFALKKMSNN